MKKTILSLMGVMAFLIGHGQMLKIKGSPGKYKDKNWYITSGMEGHLLQFGDWEGPQFTNSNGKKLEVTMVPRYTYFFNMGSEYNYAVVNNFSVFTGLNMKNIGVIMKMDTVRYKHRVYTVGAPLGFKIHSTDRKVFFKTGMDFGLAVHYKKKKFVNDKKVEKYSEWFSDRTSQFLPSFFIGAGAYGINLTANFFLCNFFNPYHAENLNYEASLTTVGIGIDFNTLSKVVKKKKATQEVSSPTNE